MQIVVDIYNIDICPNSVDERFRVRIEWLFTHRVFTKSHFIHSVRTSGKLLVLSSRIFERKTAENVATGNTGS